MITNDEVIDLIINAGRIYGHDAVVIYADGHFQATHRASAGAAPVVESDLAAWATLLTVDGYVDPQAAFSTPTAHEDLAQQWTTEIEDARSRWAAAAH